jgi:hypothetical protein
MWNKPMATNIDVLDHEVCKWLRNDNTLEFRGLWEQINKPREKGNIRDLATATQRVCLSNLENLNALFIGQALPPSERLIRLNQIAIIQMKWLSTDERAPQLLEGKPGK